MRPSVIVHGGAWNIPDHMKHRSREGVNTAAKLAYEHLLNGGSALDAVEIAVRSMEDDPVFDAGKGSVLTADRKVEMDAIIVDGETLNFGAVAGISSFAHPVSIARGVLERSEHVFFIGEGAESLATEMGMERIDQKNLITEEAVDEWERFTSYTKGVQMNFSGHDTVGAVAIDINGKIAAATSTGGITGKKSGRVGDSPVIGSGAIADSTVVGVSTTGHGESILKVQLANIVYNQVKQGSTAQEACEFALSEMERKVGGHGGVIAIDFNGNIGKAFSTRRMVWAHFSAAGNNTGIDRY